MEICFYYQNLFKVSKITLEALYRYFSAIEQAFAYRVMYKLKNDNKNMFKINK